MRGYTAAAIARGRVGSRAKEVVTKVVKCHYRTKVQTVNGLVISSLEPGWSCYTYGGMGVHRFLFVLDQYGKRVPKRELYEHSDEIVG